MKTSIQLRGERSHPAATIGCVPWGSYAIGLAHPYEGNIFVVGNNEGARIVNLSNLKAPRAPLDTPCRELTPGEVLTICVLDD